MSSNAPKILHITQNFTAGVATYMVELGSSQSEHYGATRVEFVIPAAHRMNMPAHVGATQIHCFAREGRDAVSLLHTLASMWVVVRKVRPDILHVHSTFAGVLVRLPLLFQVKRRMKVVYCANGWSFLMDVSRFKQKIYAAVERLLARVTDQIVNVSGYEHAAALRVGLPPRKMRIVRTGVSQVEYVPAASPIAKSAQGPIRMLFVGRLDRQKGFDVLERHMERLAGFDVRLDVVGAALLSRATGRCTSNRISYHGWLPRHEATRMMEQADVLVMPSRWEGLPLVGLEAMRAGTALLVSDRGPLPELVTDGVNGLIFPLEDGAAFETALRTTTKAEWRRMGERGREMFNEQYTAERAFRETDALYRELLTGT